LPSAAQQGCRPTEWSVVMAEFPSVAVDLSEQLEFPGDSYPLTGKVDVATYTVGEKEYQLQDGIDYDVVFTNAGTGVLLTGMVRAHATGECDRCLEPASFDIAGEIEEFYLFEEPEDPEAYEDGYELLGEDRIVDLGEPINDAVVMDTPFVVLCKPDCRGLCPTCGCNLNVEQCDCAAQAEAEWAEATENPFAALKNLKLDE